MTIVFVDPPTQDVDPPTRTIVRVELVLEIRDGTPVAVDARTIT